MTTATTQRRSHTVVESPLGPLTLVATGGALCGLFLDGQRHRPVPGTFGDPDRGPLDEVASQLEEYFAGVRTRFDLRLSLQGTPFQQRVWRELVDIPFGTTASYGEIATRIGQTGAARAVGLANGRNPVSIVVPCHRVVGSAGALTGYGGGIERKQLLLDFERRVGA